MGAAGQPFISVEIETNVSGEATLRALEEAVTAGLGEVFGRHRPD